MHCKITDWVISLFAISNSAHCFAMKPSKSFLTFAEIHMWFT